jgi:excisionase family DNA binding protein
LIVDERVDARMREDGHSGMDDMIRIGAAATALGVSVDTLRRWERSGRVTFTRLGGQRYVSSAELAALLRERAPAAPRARATASRARSCRFRRTA